ncbi:hypothetical protein [Thalassotalea litorea]|uniref:hypothetical protein n=1 Tax=Thalassotalea litorea TaxID=2020715 RepID=UPI00373516D9
MASGKQVVVVIFLLLVCLSIFTSLRAQAKPECEPYHQALANIRAEMRAGYREPRGEILRDKERKLKEKIRLCLGYQSRTNNPNNLNQKKGKARHKPAVKSQSSTAVIMTKNADQLGNQALVIRGKFTGKKQAAWLRFYQPSEQCRQPQTTSLFAKCLMLRDKQAKVFSKQWDEQF